MVATARVAGWTVEYVHHERVRRKERVVRRREACGR